MSKKGHKGKAAKVEEPKGLDPLEYARKVMFDILVYTSFFFFFIVFNVDAHLFRRWKLQSWKKYHLSLLR